ncbi:MAG: RNA methyltransferase [Tannerellaceae bacterium]|jgi:TrmH family RNA methyltransferase|nr:RNA methyltransferase [Tannerellaceae bacterium]
MISRNRIKYIRSLELKKYRSMHNAFVAEGNKLVSDMMHSFECEWMLAKSSWMATQGDIPAHELLVDEADEMRKVSFLATPQDVVAVFRLPHYDIADVDPATGLVLVLDGVQDPGNLGAIVRLAAWFGIRHVVCSPDTADVFAPKAVQSTMGALSCVKVHYSPPETFLSMAVEASATVYGSFLEGENIYDATLSPAGVIVMGNEGAGIRPEVERLVDRRLHIPSYPPAEVASAESLNVASAAAVICAEFRRRSLRNSSPYSSSADSNHSCAEAVLKE